jgi:hypothetical protein
MPTVLVNAQSSRPVYAAPHGMLSLAHALHIPLSADLLTIPTLAPSQPLLALLPKRIAMPTVLVNAQSSRPVYAAPHGMLSLAHALHIPLSADSLTTLPPAALTSHLALLLRATTMPTVLASVPLSRPVSAELFGTPSAALVLPSLLSAA